ncbi:hypothetical protein POTOM_005445 [Populus tomentosa]|uniref:Major facilitator superfamily (MFS) profile domain-containing protein n=1 Tax=Populus tomentosa TaxID=118781 RepID=A0A8X8DFT6_POPTO|nr:hypothetical protein POTOM_005445 [Populus tomentosa]
MHRCSEAMIDLRKDWWQDELVVAMKWCWMWKMFGLGLSEKKVIAWSCGLGVYRFDSDQDMWLEISVARICLFEERLQSLEVFHGVFQRINNRWTIGFDDHEMKTMIMAYSAITSPPPLRFHSPFHHQPPKPRPHSLVFCSFGNQKTPTSKTSCLFTPNKNIPTFSHQPLLSAPKLRFNVQYSAGEEAEPLVTDATNQEDFSWSSVILPFFFPALGGLLFGYDIGATSGATLSLQSAELSGISWFNLSAVQLGLVVSGSLYGALLGSLLVYPIADFLGRRRELITAALLYVFGGLVTGYAPGHAWCSSLYCRNLPITDSWNSHISEGTLHSSRNSGNLSDFTLLSSHSPSLKRITNLISFLQMGFLVGSIQINAVGGWRYMYGFGVPISLLMGLGMWSLPPSPRWLLLRAVQGKGSFQEYKERAISALSKLRGRPPGDKVSEKQIEEALVSLKSAYKEEETEGSFLEVFQGPSLKAFIIGGGLVLFQQITGQPSVLYYAGPILQSAGFSAAADATRVSVVIGLFKLAMTWIAVLKVDDLGRRPLLIGGVSGIALSLLLLSAYYKFLGGFPLVAVAALLLYVGCYQASLFSFGCGHTSLFFL